ncbi:RDD family protein [Rhodococcus sp. NPDC049939]|uniref:RDD family protein n=1 Tax=Rhodococcus sp. NPDC049939 TaxID=3155511 RepID=UPI00340C3436
MTTGGFDPNQAQPPYGGQQQYGQQQYGQQQYGQQQYGQQQFGGQPPQYGSEQQFYTRQFAAPDFGFNSSTPGELLPRMAARLIDSFIVGIPTGIITSVITASLGGLIGSLIGAVISVAAVVCYFVFLETTRGQTLGKQLLGLRVVGPEGGLPTQQQSLTRNGFFFLSAMGALPIIGLLFGFIGFVLMIVLSVTIANSPTKQGKHDEIAGGTRVVKV